jgi:hypothetical protein
MIISVLILEQSVAHDVDGEGGGSLIENSYYDGSGLAGGFLGDGRAEARRLP